MCSKKRFREIFRERNCETVSKDDRGRREGKPRLESLLVYELR